MLAARWGQGKLNETSVTPGRPSAGILPAIAPTAWRRWQKALQRVADVLNGDPGAG